MWCNDLHLPLHFGVWQLISTTPSMAKNIDGGEGRTVQWTTHQLDHTNRSPYTPHNPVRFADTIGLVVERIRPEGWIGMFASISISILFIYPSFPRTVFWYCSSKSHEQPVVIHEESTHITDLGTQLKLIIEKWEMRSWGCVRCVGKSHLPSRNKFSGWECVCSIDI